MTQRDWKQEYEQALRATPTPPRRGREQRRHPRLALAGVRATVGYTPGLRLLDCSGGSLVFHTEHLLSPGHRLRVYVSEDQALDVAVTRCELEETDPALLQTRYRVTGRIMAPSASA